MNNSCRKNFLTERIKGIDIRYKTAIFSCFVWGVLAHGYMLFNKISINDDISNLFKVGGTYASGRWFLGVMASVWSKFLWGTYSLPIWSGFITICFLSIIVCMLVYMFEIRRRAHIVCLGGE